MQKTIIFITGMHRSGTSLVANLLNKASVYMGNPDDLLPANFDNRFGFYESKNFLDINEKVLSKLNSQWDTTEDVNLNSDIDLSEEKVLAEEFLKNLSNEHQYIGLKDPRATLLLPFWSSVIKKNKIKVLFVIRNPLEIADSLKKRNSYSRDKSLKIWEVYTKKGLENNKIYDTLFVKYDEILDNPVPNFQRILDFLQIKSDDDTLKDMYFTLAPEIKHSDYSKEDFINNEDTTEGQKQVYLELEETYKSNLQNNPLKEISLEITHEEVIHRLEEKNMKLGNLLDDCRKENAILKYKVHQLEVEIQEVIKVNTEGKR
jgi:hypothetical protein